MSDQSSTDTTNTPVESLLCKMDVSFKRCSPRRSRFMKKIIPCSFVEVNRTEPNFALHTRVGMPLVTSKYPSLVKITSMQCPHKNERVFHNNSILSAVRILLSSANRLQKRQDCVFLHFFFKVGLRCASAHKGQTVSVTCLPWHLALPFGGTAADYSKPYQPLFF